MSRSTYLAASAALALVASALTAWPAAAATVDVMSYNINWGAPSGRRLDAIAKVIASSGADVAGLQQVRRFTGRAKKGNYRCVDQPARLARALERLTGHDWHWTFAANTNFKQRAGQCIHVTSTPRQEGVAILSRYPIVSKSTYRLPHQRSVVKVVVKVPGAGRVAVYSVHLDSFSSRKRVTQAYRVARIVKGGGGQATFLTGDMNDQPGDRPISILKGAVRDSGGSATKRSKIDYVMYRGAANLKSVRVIQTWASDHRPIVARFLVD
jgi:endonuclease/exonuclease/phosphatase family metal-dependent hydrolase